MQETPASAAAAAHERPVVVESAAAAPAGAGLDDPRFLQVLTTEHWSLLTARSLAYNEAFTRTSMFLTFLSMSFVGLALIGPPLAFSRDFLVVAAIALVFDVLIGVLTFMRVAACNVEDFQAMQGMNRIRHGYTHVVPPAIPYFVSGTFDDAASVGAAYGPPGSSSIAGDLAYGLSTSLGLVGIVMSLVGGILGAVVALLLDAAWPAPLLVAAIVAMAVFAAGAAYALRGAQRTQAGLTVRFPRDGDSPPA